MMNEMKREMRKIQEITEVTKQVQVQVRQEHGEAKRLQSKFQAENVLLLLLLRQAGAGKGTIKTCPTFAIGVTTSASTRNIPIQSIILAHIFTSPL